MSRYPTQAEEVSGRLILEISNVIRYLREFGDPGLKLIRSVRRKLFAGVTGEAGLIDLGFGDEMIEVLCGPACDRIRAEVGGWECEGIRCVSLFDSEYPRLLSEIPDPPAILYLKGNLPSDVPLSAAIVGARHADKKGVEFASELAFRSSRAGICIVSGLALGIDGAAHLGALRAKGAPTYAVLGNGVDSCYPPAHRTIYRDILAAGGAVLSEYPPGTPAYPSYFLERNRIISGLSELVIVVQAAARSGSLRTANTALEYGRSVGAVPWDVFNKRGEGTNRLLKHGAYVITSVEDVFEILSVSAPATCEPSSYSELSEVERKVIGIVEDRTEIHLDELKRLLDVGEGMITRLEIAGILRRSCDNYISLGSN